MKQTKSIQRIHKIFATTFVVGLLGLPAVAAGNPSSGIKVPSINWQPCESIMGNAECARVPVPLDYDRPRGKKIDLALARIPATDLENKIGSLFVNPGGPGGSGVQFILSEFGESLVDLTQGRFDIIGFDPRGVGASTPIRCFDSNEERNEFLADAPVFPYLDEQERPFFDLFNKMTKRCMQRKQDITRHMSTADVVRDLDLLRRAVGDRKLSYLGFSYGSFIGNTYANLFPNKIRALVIDGVLNPWLWSWSLQITSDRVATQEVFDQFLEQCDQAGSECALSGPDGAKIRFQELANALRVEPYVFEDGEVYSYDFLIAEATSALYRPEQWGGEEGYAAYFDALSDAVFSEGNESRNEAQSTGQSVQKIRQTLLNLWDDRGADEDDYQNGFEAFMGNHCGDAQYPSRFSAHRAIADYAADGSQFGPYWWWFNAGCASWPVARDRYIGPWKRSTSAPVLVVGNYFDPATDFAGAVESSRLLTNSRLLSYAGWGHIAFGRSECVTEYVVQYLLDGTLPAEGTVCPANPNPFLVLEAETSRLKARTPRVPPMGRPPFPWFR